MINKKELVWVAIISVEKTITVQYKPWTTSWDLTLKKSTKPNNGYLKRVDTHVNSSCTWRPLSPLPYSFPNSVSRTVVDPSMCKVDLGSIRLKTTPSFFWLILLEWLRRDTRVCTHIHQSVRLPWTNDERSSGVRTPRLNVPSGLCNWIVKTILKFLVPY